LTPNQQTNMKKILLIPSFIAFFSMHSQIDSLAPQQLEEVFLSGSRLELPFSEESRTITIIDAATIQNSPAPTVADLLQQVAGVDIRRRGANGMQADLYLRGGGFDQTLLLIDGIKVEDPQTGHHTLNLALPLEVIDRIEIIKGPAARVYGQNAFTGAVNIVTKRATSDAVIVEASGGSYEQLNGGVTAISSLENSNHVVHYSRNTSNGYRYNTDFDNQNYFIKSIFNTDKQAIRFLATLSDRKFGANGFYASPTAINQYEETQASVVGVSTTFQNENLRWSPRVYWKRNQDEYIYVRQDPSIYRNLHISNKIGADVNATLDNSWGQTGFGIDIAQVYLSSNNLGKRDRFMGTLFLEHRLELMDGKMDITPGVAATYFSDFDFHFFPGIDVGYQLAENWRLYANAGYTYRIPTYTDLFYSDPTTIGSEDLDPEEAISEELGLRFEKNGIQISMALFNRDSENLIDYVKENEEDLWMATNIAALNTKGVEIEGNYRFNVFSFPQFFQLGYTYIDDEVKDLDIAFSRYSINSMKHQITGTYQSQFLAFLKQAITVKHAERTAGEKYTVVDVSVTAVISDFECSVIANNIFNEEYTETNLVPMPKGNLLFGVKYIFQ